MVKKVLLVEDDNVLAVMYKDKLSNKGFDIVSVDTGSKALNTLASYKPDIILLDIMLPGGMNGFDILQIIKKNPKLKDIPVVVLTNLDSEKKTALEMGAKDYIVKSDVQLDEVVNIVKKYTRHGLF